MTESNSSSIIPGELQFQLGPSNRRKCRRTLVKTQQTAQLAIVASSSRSAQSQTRNGQRVPCFASISSAMPAGDTQAPGELLLSSNKDPAWIEQLVALDALITQSSKQMIKHAPYLCLSPSMWEHQAVLLSGLVLQLSSAACLLVTSCCCFPASLDSSHRPGSTSSCG